MILTDNAEKFLNKWAKKTNTLQFAINLSNHPFDYECSTSSNSQKFYSASVGKLVTTTLIFMALEDDKISLDTKITPTFEPTSLDNIFIINDTDHQEEVTIEHLLTHTFGVNDYFECKIINSCKFLSEVINNPDTFWTPSRLIDFTRENQVAVGKPGSIFLYSDTGFVLLGLIIEILYGASFSGCLDYYIFKPTQMNDSCLAFL